jgi:23S rRNA-/tRNA-specific pseudouridylate synthase
MDWDLEALIVWQDEHLLVVDKPAGLPVLPDGYNPHATYLGGLVKRISSRIWIVHRLDRETSGVIVLARTLEAHRHLNTQFEKRQVVKKYHALVSGVPQWADRTVRLPLRQDGDGGIAAWLTGAEANRRSPICAFWKDIPNTL